MNRFQCKTKVFLQQAITVFSMENSPCCWCECILYRHSHFLVAWNTLEQKGFTRGVNFAEHASPFIVEPGLRSKVASLCQKSTGACFPSPVFWTSRRQASASMLGHVNIVPIAGNLVESSSKNYTGMLLECRLPPWIASCTAKVPWNLRSAAADCSWTLQVSPRYPATLESMEDVGRLLTTFRNIVFMAGEQRRYTHL